MKRLSTGVLAVLMAAGLGFNAVAAQANASHGNIGTNAIAQAGSSTMAAPPANFGSPPSGQIPILYNDHHVYSKPDVLKQARVLAALVRGGTLLIPLRSMFEQMGATVSYAAGTKTVTVSKPGAEVKVTVGKPEVVINGESRPLDVPPMIYQGTVLVPVRVISEGMGAYVQWVPDQHVVVVRYIPPTPPPTPAPTEAPTAPPPTPTPTPAPTPFYDRYVAGDYIISPKVYNEFNPGVTTSNNTNGFSYRLHGAVEFALFNLPWMVEGDYRQINYPRTNTSVLAIGGLFSYPCTATNGCGGVNGRDYDLDTRLGFRVINPRIYIGIGYMWRGNNAGYPSQNGLGGGLEKLPNLERAFDWFGSAYYYPSVRGTYNTVSGINGSCTPAAPCAYNVGYGVLKYDIGVDYSFENVPLFVEAGFLGDRGWHQMSAPADFSENGPYIGIGVKF
ncbi:MAG: copper amine oxidase N-terminal domain-containing protein [Candidatus Eremiobacteraeota bacterium]|nr:copper amine oxidase N-terminal domain-containing protein [Candidatus Eremiobacteraeota bacterium]MBV8723404.1 copper amine oxidase N-terminal domain-containing protein [Candidatus Eremiobacteraeota bacterium]